MFVRIYTGLILSIILSALSCYVVFETVTKVRRGQHAEFVFSGTFELIKAGLDRHEGEKKRQWLSAVSKLIGSPISLISHSNTTLSQSELDTLFDQGLLVKADNQRVRVYSSIGSSDIVYGEFDKVAEAHIRIAAYLLLNEIGRLNVRANPDGVRSLAKLFQFPIDLVANSDVKLDRQQFRRLLRGDVVVTLETSEHASESIFAYAPVEKDIFLKLGPIPVFNTTPLPVLLSLVFLAVIITAGSAYILVSKLERRLKKVDDVVAEFGRGNMARRVEDQGHDSIGNLAHTVNGMADEIVSLIQKQKEMTQAVSHELRTPIARLKFRLSMLLEDGDQTQREARVAGMNRDVDELNNLVDEILTLQKLDYSDNTLRTKPVNVSELVREIHQELQEVHPSIEFKLIEEGPSQPIDADEHLLHRLLKNLIDNAGKYGLKQVCCTLHWPTETAAVPRNAFLTIQIEDDGPGIRDTDIPKLFTPFSRLDASRNKQTGGYGLGLAIAKRIINLHNGYVDVSSSKFGGACFTVRMPIGSEEASYEA